MAVYRVQRTRDYTVMSNYHLKDKGLTLKSKGLLSMILSLPEEWNYTTRGLASICKEGVDAIGSALKELETAGYIVRRQLRGALDEARVRVVGAHDVVRQRLLAGQHRAAVLGVDAAPGGRLLGVHEGQRVGRDESGGQQRPADAAHDAAPVHEGAQGRQAAPAPAGEERAGRSQRMRPAEDADGR